MGDCEAVISTHDGEQHVIFAAQHIVKALCANKNLSEDMRKILADLDTHLSTMTLLTESKAGLTSEVEEQLICAQERVMSWQSNQLMIWDSGPQEVSRYLQAVDEVRRLTESLGSLLLNINGKQKVLLDQAHCVLQMAMARLEKELIHILSQSKQFLGPRYTLFRSYEGSVACEELTVSTEDDSVEGTSRRDSNGTESEECVISLVHPNAVSDIKAIAAVMFASNYYQEFCQAFTSFWENALNEFLINCEVEKLSIEDVLKMKWDILNCRIRKWCRAMKTIIRFYLCSEKWLFDQVLGAFGPVCSICFLEATKASMLCLLNFGEAIAMGPHPPERLFCLINMYEVLANLLQDIDALFSEEVGSFIRIEFHELLMRLGDSARETFMKFGNEVASKTSKKAFPRGDIHPLTKYVMNYINTLAGYGDTLNLLLERQDREDLDRVVDPEDGQNASSYNFRPMACYLWSVAAILEINLDKKSRLYRDCSLKHIFMMNNIHYMVEKVKDPELGTYFGDEWMKKYTAKFQQHARSYERTTWSSVLSLLRDDGRLGMSVLRERCRGFNVAFEEIYKCQTGWIIRDVQLREDLQISTSQKVIHAYRTFIGRYSNSIKDKYIKYTEQNLETYILDLFEGSQRSLHNSRR